MTDLLALADRVEKLTGPDREIDLTIHLALHPDGGIAHIVKHPRGLDYQEGYQWDIRGASVVFEKRTADGRCPHNGGYPLPAYTASLDAAMTLVPEGFKWRCGYSRHVPHNAEVVDYNNHKGTFIGESDFNRACAITAACLRARASTDKGEA